MLGDEQGVGAVHAIEQDHLGFIWFGGVAGLARFDGYRFKYYLHDRENQNSIPNNTVRSIREDKNGKLWIATDGGIVSYDREFDQFTRHYFTNSEGENYSNWRVNTVYFDDNNQLWITGEAGGIAFWNPRKNEFEILLRDTEIANFSITDIVQIKPNAYLLATIGGGIFLWERDKRSLQQHLNKHSISTSLPHSNVRRLYKDSNSNIWVASGHGLSKLNTADFTFDTKVLQTNSGLGEKTAIWDISESGDGFLWLSTDGSGLVYFDPYSEKTGYYENHRLEKNGLSSDVVRTIFIDKNGDFWIGCYPGGVNHYDLSNTSFESYANFSPDSNLSSSTWALTESKKGGLWIGTDETGLLYFDLTSRSFAKKLDSFDLDRIGLPKTILTIYEDLKGDLWIGSWGQGLFHLDFKEKKVSQFKLNDQNNRGFNAESVWRVEQDTYGNFWIATMHNGLFKYNSETSQFKNYRFDINDPKSINDDTVWSVHFSDSKNLWVATHRGFALYNPIEDNFTRIEHDINNMKSLTHDWVQEIYEDHLGRVWVATYGGGLNLFDKQGKFIEKFDTKNGLSSDRLVGMIYHESGEIWLSSDKGLNRFNIENRSFRHFSSKNWLQGNLFFRGSFTQLSDGQIGFGGINGFTLFHHEKVIENLHLAKPHITELNMFNEVIKPNHENSILKKDIVLTDSITLPYNLNSFSLAYTSLSYRGYEENQYRYFLEGFDANWSTPSSSKVASYTNLDPGNYTFYVSASNNSGFWSEDSKKLKITILPNPWKSWWAFTIYTGLVVSLLLWLYLSQRKQIQNQRQVNDRLRELDQMKDEILANTSHELRTPLNGIIGLAEMIRDGGCGAQSSVSVSNLNMIISSARRLNNLVNDILDISKVRNNQLNLHKDHVDVFNLVAQVYDQVLPIVNQERIEINNHVPRNIGSIYADENRILQVLTNLLGNAVKYTERGEISITAKNTGDVVSISVTDTGIGIHEDYLDRIFGSFEQAPNSGVATKNGTGLGLAITERLVKLHGGKIYVDSTIGKGSNFTVELPTEGFECAAEFVEEHVQDLNKLNLGSNKKLNRIDKVDFNFKIELFGNQANAEPLGYKLSEKNLGFHFTDKLTELMASIHQTKTHIVLFMCPGDDIDTYQSIAQNIHNQLTLDGVTIFFVDSVNSSDSLATITQSGIYHYMNDSLEADVVLSYIKNALILLLQLRKSEQKKAPLINSKESNTPVCNLPCFTDRRKKENDDDSKSKNRSVLVVDDEMVNRMVLRHLMINFNFDVYEAANGEQAIDAIENGAFFDLILLDVMMPGISGYEVCQILRKSFDMTELPIIFVSAKSQAADLVKALDLGANDTLVKPIDTKLLYGKIDACLNFVSKHAAFIQNKAV